MGDADLMSAALLLDVSSYYLGLVIPTYRNPERAFLNLPFRGLPGRLVAAMMKFYNRRLATLGNRRWTTGYYGRHNAGWRELYDGFVPDRRVAKLFRKGLLRWWKAEIMNLKLMFAAPVRMSAKQSSAATPVEA